MIVNIRGTSGSGKSTLVRKLLDLPHQGQTHWQPVWSMGLQKPVDPETGKEKSRKRPWGYHCLFEVAGGYQPVIVLGHYETACGGCDSISGLDLIYGLARHAHQGGAHVLFEGLIVNSDFKRAAALATDGLPHHIMFLNTPIEECIRSVNTRRQSSPRAEKLRQAGQDIGDVNPANTVAKYELNQKMAPRLQEAGASVGWYSRDEAWPKLLELLRINP